MKTKHLTIAEFNQFPFHDAELHQFTVWRNDDTVVLRASLKIGVIDDSYDVGYLYPQRAGTTQLVFLDCRIILTDFKGGIKGGYDTIDDGNVNVNSDLIVKACNWPPTDPKEFNHFQFKLHSGSIIDIVAKTAQFQLP